MGDVQTKRCLSHRRPPGDDDQIRGLQTRRQAIQITESRRHARDHLALVIELLEQLCHRKLQVPYGNESRLDSFFRETEEHLLCAIEDLFGRLCLIETLGHDFGCCVHQLPQQAFFSNDLDIVVDVDKVWNTVEQARQVRDAACAFELRSADQFFLNRDQVDRSRSLDQLDHLPVNGAMSF